MSSYSTRPEQSYPQAGRLFKEELIQQKYAK